MPAPASVPTAFATTATRPPITRSVTTELPTRPTGPSLSAPQSATSSTQALQSTPMRHPRPTSDIFHPSGPVPVYESHYQDRLYTPAMMGSARPIVPPASIMAGSYPNLGTSYPSVTTLPNSTYAASVSSGYASHHGGLSTTGSNDPGFDNVPPPPYATSAGPPSSSNGAHPSVTVCHAESTISSSSPPPLSTGGNRPV
ncbi:hypothetical protein BJ085DRAFT_35717 [Dimargaris cristalligena]|uniref:Uncharacterized protein n=1 Tax=Dimargaris cristalligena TaxID=215637 RepID=A0A4P9ZR58_9FUNG|nr:hypothetical protein BJ085DRAFT_35717 [Dimargaris cristalligena]|eukprot:RKP35996.1 hypothetical protein BJ085DRAFT_35717 [Dimargaris cristalligena]